MEGNIFMPNLFASSLTHRPMGGIEDGLWEGAPPLATQLVMNRTRSM